MGKLIGWVEKDHGEVELEGEVCHLPHEGRVRKERWRAVS